MSILPAPQNLILNYKLSEIETQMRLTQIPATSPVSPVPRLIVQVASIAWLLTAMSSVNASSGYRDPQNPSIFIAEPHNFYSSDGTTNEPLWSSVDHSTPQSDLSGLFIDSGSLPWPEIDGTEYSPGVYSDSDRQTGFSSGLSSNSSPDDYVDFESEYPHFGNGSVSRHEH